jgi:hypothetical protein
MGAVEVYSIPGLVVLNQCAEAFRLLAMLLLVVASIVIFCGSPTAVS